MSAAWLIMETLTDTSDVQRTAVSEHCTCDTQGRYGDLQSCRRLLGMTETVDACRVKSDFSVKGIGVEKIQ